MSPNQNPFTPRDVKRRVLLSVGAGLGFLFVACIVGLVTNTNGLVTLALAVGGGAFIGFMIWQKV